MPESKQETEKPAERFRSAMRQILSVSKPELLKREAAYKKERKSRDHKAHH